MDVPVDEEPFDLPLAPDTVIVLWESALPVQEAKTRLRLPDVARTRADQFFIITVIGGSIAWDRAEERTKNWIRESARLAYGRKNQLRATDVELLRVADTLLMRFFFPRTVRISKIKDFEFRLQMGPSLVESKFNLKEMVYQGEAAL